MTVDMTPAPEDPPRRIWFWRPQWHWFGWRTLLPVYIGIDEFERVVLCLGWTVTGRVLIALWVAH